MQSAIVIRSFVPYSYKLALYNDTQGYHELRYTKLSGVFSGALCYYDYTSIHNNTAIGFLEIIDVPHEWAKRDLVFLHHVLEIIFSYVPFQNGCALLLEHLLKLYKICPIEDENFYKKIFICRIFSLLGIYPENREGFDQKFLCLISAPIDIMLNVQTTLMHYDVDAWIQGCIQAYPVRKIYNSYH